MDFLENRIYLVGIIELRAREVSSADISSRSDLNTENGCLYSFADGLS